ncbi:MAG: glycosyltransferase family 4 protein [Planctomycetota bacterium]
MLNGTSKGVAFVCSYAPRKCGIATFTSDLIASIKLASNGDFAPTVIGMSATDEFEYGESVKHAIRRNVRNDYIRAADYINFSDIEAVSVQHEFGLFGGEAGSHLGLLLERLNKTVVTTLHTVLDKPSTEQFDSLVDVCEASDKVVVMNKRGVEMLRRTYGVAKSKIELIPHGIPDLPFVESSHYKSRLGMTGRKTILTFGLLNEGKGIEVMLRALPAIVEADPSVLYIVLGATHPEVLRREGQSYKLKLENMVARLGLQRNVVFENRFVSDAELLEYLGAADVYVTPYLHKEQLTSGTLAFAVGTGRAVVSTPYWAAQELLAQGRGKLVPFGDSGQLARSVVEILNDDAISYRMKKRAYEYGRSMVWPRIGSIYWDLLKAQMPSVPIRLRPNVDSKDWTRPAGDREQVCQPA